MKDYDLYIIIPGSTDFKHNKIPDGTLYLLHLLHLLHYDMKSLWYLKLNCHITMKLQKCKNFHLHSWTKIPQNFKYFTELVDILKLRTSTVSN